MKASIFIFFLLLNLPLEAQNKDIIHALQNAPKHEIKSIDQLVNFINSNTSNDYEKAIGAYYWVASHVRYDVRKYKKDKPSNTKPKDVFRKEKAVCIGYASLYQDLCLKLHLDCEIVRGYSKGYAYKKNQPLDFANHAWNVVRIDSVWRLVDPTWGSGTLNKKLLRLKYTPHYTEDYFMVKPKTFVLKHLPETPMWQLLNYPISVNTFKSDDKKINDYLNNFHDQQFIYSDTIRAFLSLDSSSQGIKYGNMALEYNHSNTLPLAEGILTSLGKNILEDSLLYKNVPMTTMDSLISEANKAIGLLKKSKSSRKSYKKLIQSETNHGYTILACLYYIKAHTIENEADFGMIKDFNLLTGKSKPFIQSLENSLKAVHESKYSKFSAMIEYYACDNYYKILNLYKGFLLDDHYQSQKGQIQKEINSILNSTKKYISPKSQCYKNIIELGTSKN